MPSFVRKNNTFQTFTPCLPDFIFFPGILPCFLPQVSPHANLFLPQVSSHANTAGSACSSRRHLRVVVAHGCVPALRRHFNADLRMCCTWPGVAPMIAASYSCCGLTPVTNNEDAIELVLLRIPTLLARASRLRKRLCKDLTVRVPPPLVDTPRSSAMMAVFSGVLLSLTCFATALATSGRFEITTVWIQVAGNRSVDRKSHKRERQRKTNWNKKANEPVLHQITSDQDTDC